VALEDDVECRGGDVPQAELDQIINAIAGDLEKKLAGKAGKLSRELSGISALLARLIGEP